MDSPDHIVDRIKRRRLALDYSYQQLADLTDISKSTLQRYETGSIKNLPVDKLEILAKALKTTPDYLMGWEKEAEETSTTLPLSSIETAEQAMEFILKQPVLAAYGGYNITDMSEEDLIEFANDLLNQLKLISFKYKKSNK